MTQLEAIGANALQSAPPGAVPKPRPTWRRLPRAILAFPAWAWLTAFFLAPVGMVVWFSFGYKPGIFGTHANDKLSLDRYGEALSPTFFATFENTLWVGVVGTLIILAISVPFAYWLAIKAPVRHRGILLAMVMIPFWTNFLIRTIGWQIILAPEGFFSGLLQSVGILDRPLEVMFTRSAVLIGVVYNYLPLMVLPLFVAFDRVTLPLREASKDLGAGRWSTFLHITLPLAKPGLIVGILLVYIPLMGDYITATVLGGAKGNMAGQMVANQFQTAQNWALGSAMAVVLILTILGTVALAALITWLGTWPMRARRRLVLGVDA